MKELWPIAAASWVSLGVGLYYIARGDIDAAAAFLLGNVFVNTVGSSLTVLVGFLRSRRAKAGGA